MADINNEANYEITCALNSYANHTDSNQNEDLRDMTILPLYMTSPPETAFAHFSFRFERPFKSILP